MDQVVAQIQSNLAEICERIDDTADRCGRDPKEIQLVVVTKTRPVEVIRAAILAGAQLLGRIIRMKLNQKSWKFVMKM